MGRPPNCTPCCSPPPPPPPPPGCLCVGASGSGGVSPSCCWTVSPAVCNQTSPKLSFVGYSNRAWLEPRQFSSQCIFIQLEENNDTDRFEALPLYYAWTANTPTVHVAFRWWMVAYSETDADLWLSILYWVNPKGEMNESPNYVIDVVKYDMDAMQNLSSDSTVTFTKDTSPATTYKWPTELIHATGSYKRDFVHQVNLTSLHNTNCVDYADCTTTQSWTWNAGGKSWSTSDACATCGDADVEPTLSGFGIDIPAGFATTQTKHCTFEPTIATATTITLTAAECSPIEHPPRFTDAAGHTPTSTI